MKIIITYILRVLIKIHLKINKRKIKEEIINNFLKALEK